MLVKCTLYIDHPIFIYLTQVLVRGIDISYSISINEIYANLYTHFYRRTTYNEGLDSCGGGHREAYDLY
jgi:hypothetical protein